LALNVNDLAGFYTGSGAQQRGKDRTIRGNLVAGNVNYDGSQAEFRKVMLTFQFAVDCDKNIVRFRCVGNQQTVFGSAPANLAHSSDQVAWKCGFDPGIDAFI
jgi:hypothetical protein